MLLLNTNIFWYKTFVTKNNFLYEKDLHCKWFKGLSLWFGTFKVAPVQIIGLKLSNIIRICRKPDEARKGVGTTHVLYQENWYKSLKVIAILIRWIVWFYLRLILNKTLFLRICKNGYLKEETYLELGLTYWVFALTIRSVSSEERFLLFNTNLAL